MTDERGCGVREPGGIYFVTPKCEKPDPDRCAPVTRFLFCPPLPLGGLEIVKRGVTLIERPDGSGINDVYDWVGEGAYPNTADMVEEIKRMGLSRRASKSLDFSLLGPGSLIFLVHARAIVTNAAEVYEYIRQEVEETPDHSHTFNCPCGNPNHARLPGSPVPELDQETCAGLWWETLTKADPIYDLAAPRRSATRTVGSTTYRGYSAPYDLTMAYEAGIFARFPITRLEVVADPDGEEADTAYERLENARLPVREVES